MNRFNKYFACAALLACTPATLLWAAGSSASSTSSATSASVGSSSTSIQKSSASSTPDAPVAAGDYRIVEVVALAERPGTVRVMLQALADPGADGAFALVLPEAALAGGGLVQGHVVTARQRPYGLEFANAATQQAFYLVLSDDWYRELQTNAVVL